MEVQDRIVGEGLVGLLATVGVNNGVDVAEGVLAIVGAGVSVALGITDKVCVGIIAVGCAGRVGPTPIRSRGGTSGG